MPPWREKSFVVSWLWRLRHDSLWAHFVGLESLLGDFALVRKVELEDELERERVFGFPGDRETLRRDLVSRSDIRNVRIQLDLHCVSPAGESFVVANGGALRLFPRDSPDPPMVDVALHVDLYDPDSPEADGEELARANGPRLTRFLRRLSEYALEFHSVENDWCPRAYQFGFPEPEDE